MISPNLFKVFSVEIRKKLDHGHGILGMFSFRCLSVRVCVCVCVCVCGVFVFTCVCMHEGRVVI